MCLCPAQILLFQLLIELMLKLTNISCLLWKCSHFFYSVPRRDASWIWRMHFIPFVVLSQSVTSSSRVYHKAQRWQTHGSFNTVDYSPFHHFISALRLNTLKWRPLSQHGWNQWANMRWAHFVLRSCVCALPLYLMIHDVWNTNASWMFLFYSRSTDSSLNRLSKFRELLCGCSWRGRLEVAKNLTVSGGKERVPSSKQSC